MKTHKEYDLNISDIIATYNNILRVVDNEAHRQDDNEERAYGGVLRSVKGKLQEYIIHSLIKMAWKELDGDEHRMDINSRKIKIPLKKEYLSKIENKAVKKYIEDNAENYYYGLSVDKQIFIDDTFIIGIECKAYTENAMLKRIMVDFNLLSSVHANISCYLLQLESQLGGDYSQLNDIDYGSRPTHTIMSYFDIKLHIITLLEGERKIDHPIHKEFKELSEHRLTIAKDILKKDLSQYI